MYCNRPWSAEYRVVFVQVGQILRCRNGNWLGRTRLRHNNSFCVELGRRTQQQGAVSQVGQVLVELGNATEVLRLDGRSFADRAGSRGRVLVRVWTEFGHGRLD